MVSFSHLPAVKKDPIFGAARKNFDPSYIVTALGAILSNILSNILGGNFQTNFVKIPITYVMKKCLAVVRCLS